MSRASVATRTPRPTLEQMPDPMRPADVAALVGVSKDLVYKEILAGRLQVKRLGGEKRPTYLIAKAWYQEWLTGNGSG